MEEIPRNCQIKTRKKEKKRKKKTSFAEKWQKGFGSERGKSKRKQWR